MIRSVVKVLGALLSCASASSAYALSSVDPNGVNINATGATTVFLTFRDTGSERPAGAFWCGEINVPANTVTATNPCIPGTLFGNLPVRDDLGRASGTSGQSNFTDIMTIPASVSRRAYQDAQRGNVSSFFYVRHFINTTTGASSFIAVTCRLAGGGARVPLALTDVRIAFDIDKGDSPVYLLETGAQAPAVEARIHYNGSGRLTGRWEVVRPGDSPPRVEDMVPAASLPVELRARQQRYTELSRVEIFLPPTGEAAIAGPDPELIPTDIPGSYWLLLRIEATDDKEGNSNTNAGVANSGGVAGFPLPPLRYYVGRGDAAGAIERPVLLEPLPDSVAAAGPLRFTWEEALGVAAYRLEVRQDEEDVLSAIVPAGASQYSAPPWLAQPGQIFQWRLLALDRKGQAMSASEWSVFSVESP